MVTDDTPQLRNQLFQHSGYAENSLLCTLRNLVARKIIYHGVYIIICTNCYLITSLNFAEP